MSWTSPLPRVTHTVRITREETARTKGDRSSFLGIGLSCYFRTRADPPRAVHRIVAARSGAADSARKPPTAIAAVPRLLRPPIESSKQQSPLSTVRKRDLALRE